MIVPGAGGLFLAGGESPKVNLLGYINGTTLNGLTLGEERPDRIIVVAAQKELDSAGSIATPTINLAALTNVVIRPSVSDPYIIGYSVFPTGNSIDLNCTKARNLIAWELIGVTGVDSYLDTTISSGTNIGTVSPTAPAEESIILGLLRSRSTESSFSVSGSGTYENVALDAALYGGSGVSTSAFFSGHSIDPGAGSVSVTGSNNFSSGRIAYVTFK